MSHQSASYQVDEQVLEQVSATIRRRGLRLPALFLLRAGHPMTFLGAQVVWVAAPTLALLWPRPAIHQFARLLEEPTAVTALIARLDGKPVKASD